MEQVSDDDLEDGFLSSLNCVTNEQKTSECVVEKINVVQHEKHIEEINLSSGEEDLISSEEDPSTFGKENPPRLDGRSSSFQSTHVEGSSSIGEEGTEKDPRSENKQNRVSPKKESHHRSYDGRSPSHHSRHRRQGSPKCKNQDSLVKSRKRSRSKTPEKVHRCVCVRSSTTPTKINITEDGEKVKTLQGDILEKIFKAAKVDPDNYEENHDWKKKISEAVTLPSLEVSIAVEALLIEKRVGLEHFPEILADIEEMIKCRIEEQEAASKCNTFGMNETENIGDDDCKLNKVGKCPYGPEGVDCKYHHPACCQNFLTWGKTGMGCSYGTLCPDFHPKLCQNSLELCCSSEDCQMTESYHTQKCKIVRICKICKGQISSGRQPPKLSPNKRRSRSRDRNSRVRDVHSSNSKYSNKRRPISPRRGRSRSTSRHRKRIRSRSSGRRRKRSCSTGRRRDRSTSRHRKRSPVSNLRRNRHQTHRRSRSRSKDQNSSECSYNTVYPNYNIPGSITNILETNKTTITSILEVNSLAGMNNAQRQETSQNFQNFQHNQYFDNSNIHTAQLPTTFPDYHFSENSASQVYHQSSSSNDQFSQVSTSSSFQNYQLPTSSNINSDQFSANASGAASDPPVYQCPGCVEPIITESSNVVKITGNITYSSLRTDIRNDLKIAENSVRIKNFSAEKFICITFKHVFDALAFVNFYGYSYANCYANCSFVHSVDPQDISRYAVPQKKSGIHLSGIPKTQLVGTHLIACVSMNLHPISSVDTGATAKPCSISMFSNGGSHTSKISSFDEQVEREDFLLQVSNIFKTNLKRYNQNSNFDDVVLVFETYEDAWIFMEWIEPSQIYQEFLNLVNSIGVLPFDNVYKAEEELESKNNLEATKVSNSLANITSKSGKALKYSYYRSRLIHATMENLIDQKILFSFINVQCIDIRSFSIRERPPVNLGRNNICCLAIEFINKENNETEITQIGASFSSKHKQKLLNFWPIIPSGAWELGNIGLQVSLNLSKVNDQFVYYHVGQKKNINAISEKEALKSLFSFIQDKNKSEGLSSQTTLFTYSSYTTISVFLQAVQRNGLEDELYKTFHNFCDLHLIMKSVKADILDSRDQFPPLEELANTLLDTKISSSRTIGSIGIATVMYNLLNKVLANEIEKDEDYVYTSLIQKYAYPISQLMFPKEDPLNIVMTLPKTEQMFKPNESRSLTLEFSLPTEATFSVTPKGSNVKTFSISSLCLHPNMKSDFTSEGTKISKDNVTLRLRNWSKSVEIIEHIGCIIVHPKPMVIVRWIPYLHFSPPLSRHSCVDTIKLTNHVERKKQSNVMKTSINNPKEVCESKPVGFTNVFTKVEERPCKTVYSSQMMKKHDFENVSIYIISMKSIEFYGEENLLELSIYRPDTATMEFSALVIPEKIRKSIPQLGYTCDVCGMKESKHYTNDCPLLANCNCKYSSIFSKHKAKNCSHENCWNCGKGHNWRVCPLKVFLTYEQRVMYDMGFTFNKQNLEMVKSKTEIVPCLTIDEVMRLMTNIFDEKDNDQQVFIGYDIGTVLDKLKSFSNTKGVESLKPMGVIDLRWLFPKSLKNSPLEALSHVAINRNKTNLPDQLTTWSNEVVKCIAEIVGEKFDMSCDMGRRQFCQKYMVKHENLDMMVNYDYMIKDAAVFENLAPKLDETSTNPDVTQTSSPQELQKIFGQRPLRERLIHLVATLEPCKKEDLLTQMKESRYFNKKERTQGFFNEINSICTIEDHKYLLMRHIWKEVDEDCPLFSLLTDDERQKIKELKLKNLLSQPQKLDVKEPDKIPTSLDQPSSSTHLVSSQIQKQSLREELIHLLAVRPYNEKELITQITKDGSKNTYIVKEKNNRNVTKILNSIALKLGNKYSLMSHLWKEVDGDWHSFTKDERQMVKKKKTNHEENEDDDLLSENFPQPVPAFKQEEEIKTNEQTKDAFDSKIDIDFKKFLCLEDWAYPNFKPFVIAYCKWKKLCASPVDDFKCDDYVFHLTSMNYESMDDLEKVFRNNGKPGWTEEQWVEWFKEEEFLFTTGLFDAVELTQVLLFYYKSLK